MTFRDSSRRVNSGRLELLLPIVGTANAVTGVNRLDLTASVHYDKYEDDALRRLAACRACVECHV